MSKLFDHGPLDTFEVTWNSGHIEHIQAHQVLAPPKRMFMMGESTGGASESAWLFHGEIEGRWKLLLMAHDGDVRTVRNVTHTIDRATSPDSAAGDGK